MGSAFDILDLNEAKRSNQSFVKGTVILKRLKVRVRKTGKYKLLKLLKKKWLKMN